MMHYTRKRGIEMIWKTFRKQNRYQLVLNGCAGEVSQEDVQVSVLELDGQMMVLSLKQGTQKGEEEALWTKKREIQLWTCEVAVAHVSGIH